MAGQRSTAPVLDAARPKRSHDAPIAEVLFYQRASQKCRAGAALRSNPEERRGLLLLAEHYLEEAEAVSWRLLPAWN